MFRHVSFACSSHCSSLLYTLTWNTCLCNSWPRTLLSLALACVVCEVGKGGVRTAQMTPAASDRPALLEAKHPASRSTGRRPPWLCPLAFLSSWLAGMVLRNLVSTSEHYQSEGRPSVGWDSAGVRPPPLRRLSAAVARPRRSAEALISPGRGSRRSAEPGHRLCSLRPHPREKTPNLPLPKPCPLPPPQKA